MNELQNKVKHTIKTSYALFSERGSGMFNRDVFRMISKELDLPYRSDHTIREAFGSWSDAVKESLKDEEDQVDSNILYQVSANEESEYIQTIEREIPKDKVYKILVLPDIHIPFHNQSALECAIKIGEEFKPDEVIQIGDLLDCYELSRYMRSQYRQSNIDKEIKLGINVLKEIKDRIRPKQATMLCGNHEARVRKYLLNTAKSLANLDALKIENLLNLKELGWNFIEEHLFYKINEQYFTHGEFHSTNALGKNMNEYHVNLISGHTHRLGSKYLRSLDKTIGVHEIGCLASFDVATEYTKRPNWQHGCATVIIKGNNTWVNLHKITDGVSIYNDKIISGKSK